MTSVFVLAGVVVGLQGAPVLEIPQSGWADIFFGSETDPQSVHGRAAISGLQNLQKKSQPKGVIEIRIWEGFGLTYLEGYRFRQEGGRWRGWWIQPALANRLDWKTNKYLLEFKAPKQGWEIFWKTLSENQITSLPDFSSLPGEKPLILDGISYVVEHSAGGKYRTYMYDNPHLQKGDWAELKSFRTIVRTVHNAFRDQVNR